MNVFNITSKTIVFPNEGTVVKAESVIAIRNKKIHSLFRNRGKVRKGKWNNRPWDMCTPLWKCHLILMTGGDQVNCAFVTPKKMRHSISRCSVHFLARKKFNIFRLVTPTDQLGLYVNLSHSKFLDVLSACRLCNVL